MVCALFLSLIRKFVKTAVGCRLDDGGSERPEGASRGNDAYSAPQARSSLAASSTKSSTDPTTGTAEEMGQRLRGFHGLQNGHRRRGASALTINIGMCSGGFHHHRRSVAMHVSLLDFRNSSKSLWILTHEHISLPIDFRTEGHKKFVNRHNNDGPHPIMIGAEVDGTKSATVHT